MKKNKMNMWAVAVAVILVLSLCACGQRGSVSTNTNSEVISGWGDSAGGRPSYTIAEIDDGVLQDRIIFNVVSNSPMGDEKNFVGARENTGVDAGLDNIWDGNEVEAKDGATVLVRLYVDNCNPNGEDAVSENTRVAFNVPTESGTELAVHGYIYSDNADPTEYWDGVRFYSDAPFHLEYVYGGALLENNGIGADGGIQLGDEIVTKAASEHGVQIGYNELDGRIPGGSTYAAYITIQVKTVFDS